MAKHTQANYSAQYVQMWHDMRVTDARRGIVEQSARRILASRSEYMAVERATGVPWWFVGIVHKMECNCNFGQHLHNGDPLSARTKHVPVGRPRAGSPPFTWQESAIDALRIKQLHTRRDWSLAGVAYELERFNGFGYRSRGINSPYLWSMTNHYQRGKFTADSVYDPFKVSTQSGAMALLKLLTELEPSIKLVAPAPALVIPDEQEQLPPAKAPALFGRTIYGAVVGLCGLVYWVFTNTLLLAGSVAKEAQEIVAPIAQVLGLAGIEWAQLGLYACAAALVLIVYARVSAHFEGKIG